MGNPMRRGGVQKGVSGKAKPDEKNAASQAQGITTVATSKTLAAAQAQGNNTVTLVKPSAVAQAQGQNTATVVKPLAAAQAQGKTLASKPNMDTKTAGKIAGKPQNAVLAKTSGKTVPQVASKQPFKKYKYLKQARGVVIGSGKPLDQKATGNKPLDQKTTAIKTAEKPKIAPFPVPKPAPKAPVTKYVEAICPPKISGGWAAIVAKPTPVEAASASLPLGPSASQVTAALDAPVSTPVFAALKPVSYPESVVVPAEGIRDFVSKLDLHLQLERNQMMVDVAKVNVLSFEDFLTGMHVPAALLEHWTALRAGLKDGMTGYRDTEKARIVSALEEIKAAEKVVFETAGTGKAAPETASVPGPSKITAVKAQVPTGPSNSTAPKNQVPTGPSATITAQKAVVPTAPRKDADGFVEHWTKNSGGKNRLDFVEKTGPAKSVTRGYNKFAHLSGTSSARRGNQARRQTPEEQVALAMGGKDIDVSSEEEFPGLGA